MSIFYRKYELYPDSILIRDFVGVVSVDEICNSWNYLLENEMINSSVKGVVNNLTGCKLNMDIDSFYKLIDYIKSKEVLRKIKIAVICENPKTIVFPTLGELDVKELKIRPFSSVEPAVDWIMYG